MRPIDNFTQKSGHDLNPLTFASFAATACFYLFIFTMAVSEFIECRWIKSPAEKSFSAIKRESIHHQTVVAPAIAALMGGLFVSVSASFFYAGLTHENDGLSIAVGLLVFAAAVALLVYLLNLALSDAGDETELVKDPAVIIAAARDIRTNPRQEGITPDFLAGKLDQWVNYAGNYSLRLSPKKRQFSNEDLLNKSLEASGLRQTFCIACRLYFAAMKVFKIRFFAPFIGLFLLSISWIFFLAEGRQSDHPNFKLLILAALPVTLILAGVVSLFFCFTKGNYARIWYRTYKPIEQRAREEIALARSDASKRSKTVTFLAEFFDTVESSDSGGIVIAPEKTFFAFSFGGKIFRFSVAAKIGE